jgi:hypothetical protein
MLAKVQVGRGGVQARSAGHTARRLQRIAASVTGTDKSVPICDENNTKDFNV